MKKNLFIKIVMVLLIVLLAFSIVACGPKKGGDEDSGGKKDEKPDGVTAKNIADFLLRFKPLLEQIELIEDELHADITLAFSFEDMDYSLQVQADIYGSAPADNQVAIIVRDQSLSSGNIKLAAYLKDGVIYIDQKMTATEGFTKFSKLDGLELNELLSKLPKALYDAELDFSGLIEGLASSIEGLGVMLDGFLPEALTYEETTDAYILGINAEGLSAVIGDIIGAFAADGFGEYQGLIDFISDFVFGASYDDLIAGEADVANFPTIEIKALKEGEGVNGLTIFYKGDLDKATTKQEELEIKLFANVDNDAPLTGSHAITFPSFTGYVEGVLKASLTIDLGVKDLYLKADIFADPDFSVVDEEKTRPTAYLAAFNDDGTKIADLDAKYDGYTLYFDLAGLYDMLGIEAENGTQYMVDFDFFAEKEPAPEPEPVDETLYEMSSLPFKVNPNLMSKIIGQITTLVDIVKELALDQTLDLSISRILSIADGFLVENVKPLYVNAESKKETNIAALEEILYKFAANYDETKTYDAAGKTALVKALLKKDFKRDVNLTDYINKDKDGKAHTDAQKKEAYQSLYNFLDKKQTLAEYKKADIIADLNEFLAKFATGYDETEEYNATQLSDLVKTLIFEFTGVEVSVADIINAGTGSSKNAFIYFGLIEEGLGIELDISTGASKADKVLNVKVELDIVPAANNYNLPDNKDYTGAIDLNSDEAGGNIYYVLDDEGDYVLDDGKYVLAADGNGTHIKKYVILDELVKLLEAYRAYTAA